MKTYLIFTTIFLRFSTMLYSQSPAPPSSPTPEESRILSLLSSVEANNRLVAELTEESLQNLPVGVKKTIGNKKYILAIDSVTATERGTFINVHTAVTFNTMNGGKREIAFSARGVEFSPGGIQASATGRLTMVSAQRFPINEQVAMVLPGDGHNYVEWDCKGFKSVNLKGLLEFSDKFFTPAKRLAPDANKVEGAFEVNTADLSNILLAVSITPFELKGLNGMAFDVTDASWDMSDMANPSGFALPADYAAMYDGDIALWQGFFLKQLNVYLPSELGDRQVQVENFWIDDYGVSGSFSVMDVMPYQAGGGGATGWPMSIDKLTVQLTANKLTGGGMSGAIGIPFLSEDTLGYMAQIISGEHGLDYSFAASFPKEKKYSCPLGATIKIHKGSTIRIDVVDGRFAPSVVLNGELGIQNGVVNIDSLTFEELYLTADAPYLKGGRFAHSTPHGFKLAGFGISVSDIVLGIASGRAALGVDAKVSLMSQSDKGISADTRFTVTATVDERQHWEYAGFNVDEIALHCKLSLFTLDGRIALYQNHPTYGNGFSGAIALKIDKLLEQGISADIRFGTVEGYKYWYAKFGVPIVIPMGYVSINGIEGGAYHHMTKVDLNNPQSDYVPDKSTSMGFMAGIGLSVVQKNLIFGDVDFEIAFNNSWGVRFIQFQGDVRFFSGTTETDNPPVHALLNMYYDFDQSIFQASLKTYMNVAGGVLKGSGAGGLVGDAVIYSGPSDWYVYIGRPSVPLGVDLLSGLVTAKTYFMCGSKIEDMPLPPPNVQSVLGNIDLNFMQKENAIATGKGMGFGVSFDISVGFGKEKGFVYAFLNVGAGADIMLRDYGDAECYGGSGVIGIDGWYASGQAYVYMQGKIGIRAKRREFDIMGVSMAALLQAKLPNPTWMHGVIAARYSILGGLLKGKVNVDVTVGEECKIVSNGGELGDLQLIGDISPDDKANDVDVFAAPQVAFNTTMDTEFSMMNIYDEANTYRVKFDDFKLIKSDNETITGEIKWNNSKDVAVMKLRDILPGETQLTAEAKVHIEKKNGQRWEALTVKGGAIDYEVKQAVFKTGAAPTTVPDNNVPYSYPLKNQYHFYKDESGQGYIKLRQGQPDLFYATQGGSQWKYIARFTTPSGKPTEVTAQYDKSAAAIKFAIPNQLSSAKIYNLQIVRQQVASGSIDSNARRSEQQVNNGSADSIVIAQNRLEGSIGSGGEKVLHELAFRTSSYGTFAAKMNSLSGYRELYTVENSLMSLLAIEGRLSETFDRFELSGQGEDMPPLVEAVAVQTNNDWLNKHVIPLVYELYGSDHNLTLDRDISELGLVPLKGLSLFNNSGDPYQLDDSQKTAGSAEAHNGKITCRYNLAYYVNQDYHDLLNKAAARYAGTGVAPTPQAARLLSGTLDDIHEGKYAFKIGYRLPGAASVSSDKEYSISFLEKDE